MTLLHVVPAYFSISCSSLFIRLFFIRSSLCAPKGAPGTTPSTLEGSSALSVNTRSPSLSLTELMPASRPLR